MLEFWKSLFGKEDVRLKEKLYDVGLAFEVFRSDPSVTIELSKVLPRVYTFSQMCGVFPEGLEAALYYCLIKDGKDHAGRNAHFTVRASNDQGFQYIDVEDNGPGIRNLDALRERVLEWGLGRDHNSSLSLACGAVKMLGGAIIPSNIEDSEGNILGARFRMQLPLERSKMNTEYSRSLRHTILDGFVSQSTPPA